MEVVISEVDNDLRTLRDVQVKGRFRVCIQPEAIATQAHEERNWHVGARSFRERDVTDDILQDVVLLVEGIESLAETEHGTIVFNTKFPVCDFRLLARDLAHCRAWVFD
jgi:hypothetical protein